MKIKSRTSAKKRVRFTSTGKVKVMKASRKHLLQQKSSKQKRLGKVGGSVMLSSTHKKTINRSLPHG